jgi:fructose-1-phosphate kinase PfkB-like protein
VEHIVAVTKSKAYAFSRKERHFANLFGFSDAILAGMVYGLNEKKSLKEALALGSMAGYITIQRQEKFCSDLEKITEGISGLHIKELEI